MSINNIFNLPADCNSQDLEMFRAKRTPKSTGETRSSVISRFFAPKKAPCMAAIPISSKSSTIIPSDAEEEDPIIDVSQQTAPKGVLRKQDRKELKKTNQKSISTDYKLDEDKPKSINEDEYDLNDSWIASEEEIVSEYSDNEDGYGTEEMVEYYQKDNAKLGDNLDFIITENARLQAINDAHEEEIAQLKEALKSSHRKNARLTCRFKKATTRFADYIVYKDELNFFQFSHDLYRGANLKAEIKEKPSIEIPTCWSDDSDNEEI